MEVTILGEFDTRRDAELAVEHVVHEFGVPRGDVFVEPAGDANSVGTRAAGADAKAAPDPQGPQKLAGAIRVSVDFHADEPQRIVEALKSAGAKNVLTK
jgi:hypothetical protein